MMTSPTPNSTLPPTAIPGAQPLCALCLTNRGDATTRVPVTTGVSLPRGVVMDPQRLTVSDPNGQATATQVDVTAKWSDGSCKWVLLNFVAQNLPSGSSEWRLMHLSQPSQDKMLPIAITPNGSGFDVAMADQSWPMTLPLVVNKEELTLQNVRTEQTEGTVRSDFWIRGNYANGLHLSARISRWRDCEHVRCDVTLHNPNAAKHAGGLWDLGDAGSIVFDSFELAVGSDADSVGWSLEGGELEWADVSKRLTKGWPIDIYQDSSGRENWQSTNHWNSQRKNPSKLRGYRANTPRGEKTGQHAQPVVALRKKQQVVSACVPEFWQQFPTALHASRTRIHAALFPAQWAGGFELQGGEKKTSTVWVSASETPHVDVVVAMAPEWIQATAVFPWFSKETTASHSRLDRFLSESLGEGTTWDDRRDVIDEYGWRNFGDVHADHEQRHYKGDGAIISHYNNQFDMIFGGIQHYARTGDVAWFDFFDPLSRHVADIDVYHTTKDRSVYNGGLFWHTDHYSDARTATHRTYSKMNADGHDSYGGGLSDEHCYTLGLLNHYYLTGNPASRDAVLEQAEWVFGMEDGTQTILALVDDEPTGLASATKFPDFHGPGRGSGNCVNALIDAWLLTTDRRYLNKADQLIRRVVHPNQDLNAMHLADSEGHWSYTVLLLSLARYLELKIELGELDEMYAYGRATMQHYGRWMAEHEKSALSVPEELEFVTEAWAVQDVRKANVVRLCAMFEDDPAWVEKMRSKADEIADRSWHDLYTFEDRYNARAISILMTEGLRDAWHRDNAPLFPAPQPEWSGEFGSWEMFVGQRDRVKQGVKNPKLLARMLGRALHPKRWVRFVKAAKKQFG